MQYRIVLPGNTGNELAVLIFIELAVDACLQDEGVDLLLHACQRGGFQTIMRTLNASPDAMRIHHSTRGPAITVLTGHVTLANTLLKCRWLIECLHGLYIALIDRNIGTIARSGSVRSVRGIRNATSSRIVRLDVLKLA
ncbi:hypothetical protein C041_02787 [Brucella abortus 63/59]|nr:hypothetical protein C041_02787 [Brucella abortus 63/59]ENP55888.1 hypothetical protein C029_02089 [Brucella abortus 88/19]ENP99383.1 hypothetical protein C042_02198 [Brucella abortus F3/07-1]ERU26852.1 hypothetical protein P042_01603 [Brucella abortus 89-2646-1238]